MASESTIDVEVAYASLDTQTVVAVRVPVGTTVRGAVERSGILQQHPDIDLAQNKVGVFGQLASPDQALQMDDRVEIYRPLRIDPKVSRKRRARRS